MKKNVTVFWLMPATSHRDLLAEYVRILAKQFEGPRFSPHLTLCQLRRDDSVRHILRGIRSAPVSLRIVGVSFSAKYPKTLFVRVAPNESVRKLIVALGGKPASLRDPHVSLMYQTLPAATKRALASSIKLPFREIAFDAVKAVRCVAPMKTRADVESWRVVGTRRLTR